MVKRTGWDGMESEELMGGYWEGEMKILLGFKQTTGERKVSVLIAPHGCPWKVFSYLLLSVNQVKL